MIESTTDVRLVEGLSERFDLTLVLPTSTGRSRISQEPGAPPRAAIGPASRVGFAAFVVSHLLSRGKTYDCVIVQGYGLAALAANLVARATGLSVSMLVCSPAEAYYRSRRLDSRGTMRFHWHELYALKAIAWLNAKLGNRYIVISRHLEQVVRSHGAHGSIVRIPVYGVDTALFRPSRQPTDVKRRRRGLPETGALLFFSSRIAPEKDADTLLHAVRILRQRGRPILVLHRSGGFLQFVEAAREIGVADLVIASDAAHPNEGLNADYQACDLCVQARAC